MERVGGGKRESQSVESDPQAQGLYTWEVAIFTRIHRQSPLTSLYVISAFYMSSVLVLFKILFHLLYQLHMI